MAVEATTRSRGRAYVVAGIITRGDAAIPWFYLRQLHDLVDSSTRRP